MLIISYWWFIDEYISMLFMEIWDVYYCLLIAHPKADWQAVGFPNCLGEKPWVGTARISCSTTWVFQVRCRCGFVDLIRSWFGTFDIRQQGAASSMFHTQLWKMGKWIFAVAIMESTNWWSVRFKKSRNWVSGQHDEQPVQAAFFYHHHFRSCHVMRLVNS
jgi:hypothetical protein